jgi:REP element-mobilizing transposase RayT
MARTIYSEIHLHITWHPKNSAPVITAAIETQLYRWLRGRILQAPGVLLLAIGGTDDHVHLAVTVPPTLLVRSCQEIGGLSQAPLRSPLESTPIHEARLTVPDFLTASSASGSASEKERAPYMNHTLANRKIIEWQTGYGIVSFGTKAPRGLSPRFAQHHRGISAAAAHETW